MTLRLQAVVNGEPRIWPLQGERLGIGRSSRNAIQIADATVSKEHAEIVHLADGWWIRDLGSRNGTRVNQQEAPQPTRLQESDLLEIGSVILRVLGEAAEELTQWTPSQGVSSSLRLNARDILGRSGSTAASPGLVHVLAEAGRVLVLPRPLHETCEEILKFVEKAIPASRLILLLRDRPGAEPVQMAGRFRGGSARQPLAISRAILDTVLNECTSVITADAAMDPRFAARESIIALAVHSAMAVPLFDNEKVLGVLYADTSDFTVTYGQEQLEILTLLGNMAAVKITNARLLEAEQASQRMAQELATATRIQQNLLPDPPVGLAGWECAARLLTCYEVGGDLYDFYLRPDGRLIFALGDVSGKGMGAALLMSSVLSSARVLYDAAGEVGELVRRLNAVVHRGTDSGHFVTLFLGELDLGSGRLTYVNAGHNAPLVLGPNGVTALPADGVPLAVLPEFPYESRSIELQPGSLFALFTDGIPEARNGEEFFGDDRIRDALLELAKLPDLEQVADGLVEKVEAFTAGGQRSDDITLVMLRRAG
ncbi:MAG TPA: SpoIIE family protein phosphatase [Candidatus Sulfotelmatobacter sp.]|nr:SpoIIE family protein phosphatase [Candidatus Sulfotelmatobacter sp.]